MLAAHNDSKGWQENEVECRKKTPSPIDIPSSISVVLVEVDATVYKLLYKHCNQYISLDRNKNHIEPRPHPSIFSICMRLVAFGAVVQLSVSPPSSVEGEAPQSTPFSSGSYHAPWRMTVTPGMILEVT